MTRGLQRPPPSGDGRGWSRVIPTEPGWYYVKIEHAPGRMIVALADVRHHEASWRLVSSRDPVSGETQEAMRLYGVIIHDLYNSGACWMSGPPDSIEWWPERLVGPVEKGTQR